MYALRMGEDVNKKWGEEMKREMICHCDGCARTLGTTVESIQWGPNGQSRVEYNVVY